MCSLSEGLDPPTLIKRGQNDRVPPSSYERRLMDFAFETTLSGLTYERRLQSWKEAGYRIEIVYLRLRSTQLALRRIAARVRQGGHNVPRADVVRRFSRGWENFQHIYRSLADSWAVYDNSGDEPKILEKSS
jgi:predicted ABC-type ATPase